MKCGNGFLLKSPLYEILHFQPFQNTGVTLFDSMTKQNEFSMFRCCPVERTMHICIMIRFSLIFNKYAFIPLRDILIYNIALFELSKDRRWFQYYYKYISTYVIWLSYKQLPSILLYISFFD